MTIIPQPLDRDAEVFWAAKICGHLLDLAREAHVSGPVFVWDGDGIAIVDRLDGVKYTVKIEATQSVWPAIHDWKYYAGKSGQG